MIRPEARALLWQWRDVFVAIALILFGLWWASGSFGFVRWIGYGLAAMGVMLAIAGVQRARFRQGNGGPGVVQLDERRLAYFGPLSGGVLDLNDLVMLELEPAGPHWVLTGTGGQRLDIPINALGSEVLFDAFATLPGIQTTQILDALTRTPDARVTIWQQLRPQLH